PRDDRLPTLLALEPLSAQPGEQRHDERDDKERHSRRARLLDHRHERPPELVERRAGSQTYQEEEQADAADPQREPAPVLRRRAKHRECDDWKSEVLRVKLETVLSPIGSGPGIADKILHEELKDMAPRDRVGGRAGKAVVALCAGRERDVLDERQQLYRREAEAERHRPERQREPCDPSRSEEHTSEL